MLYEHIISMPWWRPSHLYGGKSVFGNTVEEGSLMRNAAGQLYKNGELLVEPAVHHCDITAEWNLDFEQTNWGQRERFQIEDIKIIQNDETNITPFENMLWFRSNPHWAWFPSINRQCYNTMLSLRIGGCLVEIWQLGNVTLNYEVYENSTVYTLSYLTSKCRNYQPKTQIVLFGFTRILFQVPLSDAKFPKEAVQCEFQQPLHIRHSDHYRKEPRLLLLDWYRQKGTIHGIV